MIFPIELCVPYRRSQHVIRSVRFAVFLTLSGLAFLLGCQRDPEAHRATELIDQSTAADDDQPTATLRVVVVDDLELGKAIELRWQQVGGTTLEIESVSSEAFVESWNSLEQSRSVDAVVYPARWMGELVERGLIAGMPRRFEQADEWDQGDLLPLVRSNEIRWGKTTYAIPFGSAPFMLAYRPDLLIASAESTESTDLQLPPSDWDAFPLWLNRFTNNPASGDKTTPFAAPMAPSWAAAVLLSRVASDVRQDGQVSTVFRFQDMQPLIDQPPYVRGLESLIDWLGDNARLALTWTPEDVLDRVLSGKSAVGWTWMSAMAEAHTASERGRMAFAEFPASSSYFRFSDDSWNSRGDERATRATFLGFHGRIGSVVKSSRRQYAAWNFLLQLSGGDAAAEVSSASRFTAPFRFSQLESVTLWTDSSLSAAENRDYSRVVKSTLSERHAMLAIRVTGHADYWQALDEAVRSAVAGDQSPRDALRSAAEKWQKVTEQLGRDKQIRRYSRSLGIDP